MATTSRAELIRRADLLKRLSKLYARAARHAPVTVEEAAQELGVPVASIVELFRSGVLAAPVPVPTDGEGQP